MFYSYSKDTAGFIWLSHTHAVFFSQIESEENVLICLRIIIELHKQFRPPISQEVRVSALLPPQKIHSCPRIVSLFCTCTELVICLWYKESVNISVMPEKSISMIGFLSFIMKSKRDIEYFVEALDSHVSHNPLLSDSSLSGLCEADLQRASQSRCKYTLLCRFQ